MLDHHARKRDHGVPTSPLTASTLAIAIAAALAFPAPTALAQLRVANWNVTNYSGGRVEAFQTAVYGVFEGRSMSPDVLIGQEFISNAAVAQFVALLNDAPGSPGDWAAAPFINGPDTDSAFFYRESKVDFLGVTTVAIGGGAPNHPRNIQRYDVRPVGYTGHDGGDGVGGAGATVACYSVHMKAGSSGADQARRLLEAQRIRADAEGLPAGWHFLVSGDFNIQSSLQAAYQELVAARANNEGRFRDPIATPGTWNNNGAFRFVHTQDPAGQGGMDDRHDQILLCSELIDRAAFDYRGEPAVPYSTTAWDDANHSYRAWGNDGTSFNAPLRIEGNTMVGPVIALALANSAAGQGHLPVFLDLLVPAEVGSETALDLGEVEVGSLATIDLTVWHAGDMALWGKGGLADLRYTLEPSPGFAAPTGPFVLGPGVEGAHTLTMDTSKVGPLSGTVTILSDAPDEPVRVVALTGAVVGAVCAADVDGNGDVDSNDFFAFLTAYFGGDADFDANGRTDSNDFFAFLNSFFEGC